MNPQLSPTDLRTDVLAATAGDVSAYGRLVDRHRALVTSIALAEVRDRHASEDVAQEVFLHAWTGLKTLRNPDSFLPWLREITRNRSRRAVRTRASQKLDRQDPEAALSSAVDAGPGATEQLVQAEEQRVLREALERLPDDAREVLTLFHREGCSTQQVAHLLGLSDEAVRKRLSRARAALKEDVERAFGLTARDSSPGPAFTAMVLAALPTGGPITPPAAPWPRFLGFGGLVAAALVVIALARPTPEPLALAPPRPAVTLIAPSDSTPVLPAPAAAAPVVEPAPAAAVVVPSASRIEGEVQDSEGNPAAGAQVVAVGERTLRDTTDAHGQFWIGVAPGSYRVAAWKGASAGNAPEPIQLAGNDRKRGLVIRLGAPARVEGTVVAAAGGETIAGASVAFAGTDGAALFSTVSDRTGAFAFSGVPSELDLVVTAPTFAAQVRPRIHFEPGKTASLRVELDRESIIEGALLDAAGQPVPGAAIRLSNGRNGGQRPGDAQSKAISAADGTFRFVGLVRGSARIGAISGERNAPNVLLQLEPGKTTHVELKIFDNGIVRGSVKSADGKPIVGRVMVRAAPKMMSDETGLVARYEFLNADGTYELQLLPGEYRIGAFVDGPMQDFKRSTPITVEPGKTLVTDLTLPQVVEGRVVDPSGAPVANARVSLQAPRFGAGRGCFWFDSQSDAEGRFRFPRPTCAPTFVARAISGGGVVESGEVASGVSDLRLQLQRPAQVAGKIRGLHLAGFKVRLDQTPWVASDHEWFEFTGDAFTLNDVPAGTFDLFCQTADGLTGRATLTTTPGGKTDVTIDVGATRVP